MPFKTLLLLAALIASACAPVDVTEGVLTECTEDGGALPSTSCPSGQHAQCLSGRITSPGRILAVCCEAGSTPAQLEACTLRARTSDAGTRSD